MAARILLLMVVLLPLSWFPPSERSVGDPVEGHRREKGSDVHHVFM
jgi:hypothetical protein